MSFALSAENLLKIQAFLASGYGSENEVVRDALDALEQRQSDLNAIRAGIADMEAGRYRPFAEIDAEFRQKYGIPRE